MRQIGLLIIDEIHLLGEERGAVLEAIVSRTRYISQYGHAEKQHQSDIVPLKTRIMGLSTALANPCGELESYFDLNSIFIFDLLKYQIYYV